MSDQREMILQRVLNILLAESTDAGLKAAVRNRALLKNEERPAAVLLDGDEKPAIILPLARVDSRYKVRPQLMIMSPELYILLDENRPSGASTDGTIGIGTTLNTIRVKVSNAICNDASLATLLGANGGIAYNGAVTDLKSGSALAGQMRLDFQYRYFFNPQES